MDRVYMDHAATTPLCPESLQAMLPWLEQGFGNPSSVHFNGREARKAVEAARRQVAEAIGAQAQEIFFTSGGTESDNWALQGSAFAHKDDKNHIITSVIEHHAVLHTCQWLEDHGFRVTYLPVTPEGIVDPVSLEASLTAQTMLVSLMTANNEIGTLQPIAEFGKIAHAHGICFHTDAVQAIGAIPVRVDELGVDLLSLSAHKFYGPKGIGALYVRQGTRLDSLMHGGAQERGRRAGTENVAAIVGMGAAIEQAVRCLEEENHRVFVLRTRLINGLLTAIPGAQLNGSATQRLPGNANVSFDGVEGEALLLRMDLAGVSASSGSACTSGSLDPSHVLMALGLTENQAKGSLRLTLGRHTTEAEVDHVIRLMQDIVASLRSMTGYSFS